MLALCAGCDRSDRNLIQGYVEGEYIYISSAVAGTLRALHVERGTQVKVGDPLFELDDTPEKAARDEAKDRVAQARANLDDARRGKRPTEIASLEAQIKQAEAALRLTEEEFSRQERLMGSEVAARLEYARALSRRDQDREQIAQLQAELETARLGAREDQIKSTEAVLRAQEAALVKAEWNLSQTRQNAPQAGLVFDTIYRPGEWVAAGRPVVSLLPPENTKVRAFVPEPRIGSIHLGDTVRVGIDGVTEQLAGKVNFISPQAEYTPPVIYSEESRSKLVFMIEVVFDPAIAGKLHPGQPVDVRFGP